MKASRLVSPFVVAVLVAIGCGGGKPQEVSATSNEQGSGTVQLAQAPAEAQPSGPTGSASIHGTVRFEGTAPSSEKIKMDADPVCQQQHATSVSSEAVVVNSNGTLQHVFVYVKEGAKGPFPPATQPVVLDQSGCWYRPHVFGIQVNQPLEIVNSDATLHNINAKPTVNQPFSIAQPVKGMKSKKAFAKPEVMVKFKCNVHPWMNTYAGVLDHPFFSVSGADGSFAITGLPAGAYVLEAWHETYGAQMQHVTVGDGESKSVAFTFKGK